MSPSPRVPRRVSARALTLTSGLAAAALTLGGTAMLTAPVASSAPAIDDCPTAHPVEELTDAQPVTGLTVSKGTVPEEFEGEVIGVIDDGIAPDLDMIMVRLSSPEIDRVGGIWSGMSGSPVYAEDGRLIGAVAYGLSWGSSPVAGVTPYADMAEHLGSAPAARIAVSPREARLIAARTSVTQAQAANGFRQLPVPVAAVGVGQSRLDKVRKRLHTVSKAQATGGATAAAGAEAIVAGGNIGATLTHGFITFGGVGTVTALCGDRVLGFGHPMAFAGKSTYGLNPASAVYIQEDSLGAPFKVANFAPAVGTITDDRLAAIAGNLGAVPDAATLSSKAAYDGRTRNALTSVYSDVVTADATYVQMMALLDRVYDGYTGGTAAQTWTVSGRRANGTPWSYTRGNRYRDANDLAWIAPEEVASEVWRLSSFPGVKVDSVTTDTTTVDDDRVWKLAEVQHRVKGKWRKIERRERVVARPGKTLRLQAVLKTTGAKKVVPFALNIPKKVKGGQGMLRLHGGGFSSFDFEEEFFFGQPKGGLNAFLDSVKDELRNDQVQGNLSLIGQRGHVQRELRSAILDRVVEGRAKVRIQISRR
ncbi:SpoIVB peptidase S55 domain-containing protein [Nocardioides sp.]|uniref:SpoIVB peptidase S55 domain-containing protein n=1 Tax=Nocardioides sp. TaxID=35761 RepID=UPI002735031C|nr:SpoIVB peptidase S55 domain-containing protein [Nocardioides sp.]MDP3892267.1 SpoIVB peptidase S55 domain-containing protein [Nocardioides sp.]